MSFVVSIKLRVGFNLSVVAAEDLLILVSKCVLNALSGLHVLELCEEVKGSLG